MTRNWKIVTLGAVIVLVALAVWLLWFGGLFGYNTGTEFVP